MPFSGPPLGRTELATFRPIPVICASVYIALEKNLLNSQVGRNLESNNPMRASHIEVGPRVVEKYLLGQLDSQEADALEDRYFADPVFFRTVVLPAEEALIESYLRGQLPPSARDCFEARYSVPQLRAKVEEARRRLAGHQESRVRVNLWWKPVLAGVAALAIGLGVWSQVYRRSALPQQVARVELAAAPPTITLHLEPGLIKDGNARPVGFVSTPNASVRFSLELPGEKSTVVLTAQLFAVEADGHWRGVWAEPKQAHSSPAQGGQELTIDASADLPPGDFILQLTGPDGQVRDSYVFR